jgi:drug/metabolite transporter (DMT)-like permease
MRVLFEAFVCALMISSGQVLWKISLNRNGGFINKSIPLLENFINLFTSPFMIGGMLVYFVATFFWMHLLGKYDYSRIYPMISMVYIIALLYAVFLFHEHVTIYKWIGTLFIMIGIYFISR